MNALSLPPRRPLIGTGVSITDYDEVLGVFDRAVECDERIFVCCAPASSLVYARSDSQLASAYANAAVVTPDGAGVVLAAKLLGEAISERVYGPDLMLMQLERAASNGTPTYFYGGFDESALATLLDEYRRRFPTLNVVGSHSPPHRALSAEEEAEAVARINDSGAAIVWVGLGSPKQELWMHELRTRLSAPVLCGVGAAFDFHAGRVAQAPLWMQRNGLEWLHRLSRDPIRLGRRYLLTLPKFVALVASQFLRERLKRG